VPAEGRLRVGVERIDRHQDGAAIFKRDVLDARQRPQHAGNVPRSQFIEPTQHQLQLQQHGHRDEGSFGERCNGRGPLFGGLRIVGVIDEEPCQDVRIQGPPGLLRRARVSSGLRSRANGRDLA